MAKVFRIGLVDAEFRVNARFQTTRIGELTQLAVETWLALALERLISLALHLKKKINRSISNQPAEKQIHRIRFHLSTKRTTNNYIWFDS